MTRLKKEILSRFFINAIVLLLAACFCNLQSYAQGDATVNARIDAQQIMVGDQLRLFIEVQHNKANTKLQWAAIPDSFDHLEVLEKGKIDTLHHNETVIYRQRILITGFDSGVFTIPSFSFIATHPNGVDTLRTDSFRFMVQTVAVDTTKPFRPIKGNKSVDLGWLDYIWYIAGGLALVIITIILVVYFMKRKKPAAPPKPRGPVETLQERMLRKLTELEKKKLWEQDRVKEYYIELTDIVRNYIEERFNTPAMELTTDELMDKVKVHREMIPYTTILSTILNTADLAKFAKAKPMPEEHIATIDNARQFIVSSTPAPIVHQTSSHRP